MSKVEKEDNLPKNPFNNIAISLSGGGFRATAFHLGVLSYLSIKNFKDVSLLDRTRILSTVSAGTFVGIKYASTIKQGGTMKDCYKSLYTFMTECDLVSEALKYLSEDNNWNNTRERTLINAFASVYHKKLEPEAFGILWNETPSIHLKEIIFNATEFNFGLPFSFQKTERPRPNGDTNYEEFIGNRKIHIPVEVAKEIRLADILAASACFPFGFEPMNFPDDFIHSDSLKLRDMSLLPQSIYGDDKIHYPFGLMDGSIDDNQGVDGVLKAEGRLKEYSYDLKEFYSDDDKAVDLYIISDASPHKIDSYTKSTDNKINFIGKWNFESLKYFGITSVFVGISAIIFAFYSSVKVVIIGLTIFGTLGLLTAFVLLIFSIGLTTLTRKIGVPAFVVKRLLHFNKLKIGTLYNLFLNRKKSAMTLVSDVFIRHMRWFSFERVYSDAGWRPRLIMNAIYEFKEEEVKKRKKKHPLFNPEILEPGEEIITATERAHNMSTKLWFTPEELEGHKNKPNTIIACGQFTICFSLLDYMEKYIKNDKYKKNYDKYSDETKKAIHELETQLLEDWVRFKKNPYWMVNEWNKF